MSLFNTKQSRSTSRWENHFTKESPTFHSVVQSCPLDQSLFIIQISQERRTGFINSAEKSSQVFCFWICLERVEPLVADTEAFVRHFCIRSLLLKIQRKRGWNLQSRRTSHSSFHTIIRVDLIRMRLKTSVDVFSSRRKRWWDQILQKNGKTSWQQTMTYGASLEASLIDIMW